MSLAYLQPGSYVLPRNASEPKRVWRISRDKVHYLEGDKEHAVHKNRIAWVGEGSFYNMAVKNMWVEV